MQKKIADFISSMSRTSTPEQCLSTLFEMTNELGFPRAMFLVGVRNTRDGEPVLDQTRFWSYDGGPLFDSFYFEHDYHLRDPLAAHVLESSKPVHWNNPAYKAAVSQDELRIFAEGRDFGYLDGYTLPIHYEHEQFPGALTIVHDRDDDPDFTGFFTREGPVLHLAVYYFHAILLARFGREIIPENTRSGKAIVLTPRERECLQWSAAGLVSKEIAECMRISERTVNLHIAGAMRRLMARTRTQAVAKALARGLISM